MKKAGALLAILLLILLAAQASALELKAGRIRSFTHPCPIPPGFVVARI